MRCAAAGCLGATGLRCSGRHHRRDCVAAGRRSQRDRAAERAAASGVPGRLLPPFASGSHRCHHAADRRARPLLAPRPGLAPARRIVPLAGQAKLHGPTGGRNPHARLAAAPGSLVANRLRRGARLAEPGEFTFRAFLAGRIDLTQAEAVLGVIDAADPGQLRAALVQLAGGLARPLHQLRDELLDLLADLEANLDFAEEDATSLAPGQLLDRLARPADRSPP